MIEGMDSKFGLKGVAKVAEKRAKKKQESDALRLFIEKNKRRPTVAERVELWQAEIETLLKGGA